MARPQVSVVIPAYNAATFLRRAVDSVRAQTWTDWEIVIVDDASTDGTFGVATALRRELGDRLQIIRQRSGGASAARNTGITAAHGRFIAFLDADDEFLPDRLERQLDFFNRQPQLGLIFSDYRVVRLDGSIARRFDDPGILARHAPCEEIAPKLRALAPDFFAFLLRQHFISPITALVRRDVLGAQIRYPVGLDYWEERVFFLEVARAAPAGWIDAPLAINHHVAGSLSRSDTLRNLVHRVRAMEEMERRFGDAGPDALRQVRGELADCIRALALAHYKQRNYAPAAELFSRSLRLEPSLRGAVHWLQAAVRAIPAAQAAISDTDTSQPIR